MRHGRFIIFGGTSCECLAGPVNLKCGRTDVSYYLNNNFGCYLDLTSFREAREAERTEALAGAVCMSVDAKREPKPYACTYNVSHGCME